MMELGDWGDEYNDVPAEEIFELNEPMTGGDLVSETVIPERTRAGHSTTNASSVVQAAYATKLGSVSNKPTFSGRRAGTKQSYTARVQEDVANVLAKMVQANPNITTEVINKVSEALNSGYTVGMTEEGSSRRIRTALGTSRVQPGSDNLENVAAELVKKTMATTGRQIMPLSIQAQRAAFENMMAQVARDATPTRIIQVNSTTRKYVKDLALPASPGSQVKNPITITDNVIDLFEGAVIGDSLSNVEGRTLALSYIALDFIFYLDRASTAALVPRTFPVFLCQWSQAGVPATMRSVWQLSGTNMPERGFFASDQLPTITVLKEALITLQPKETSKRVTWKVTEKEMMTRVSVGTPTGSTWVPAKSGGLWLGTFANATTQASPTLLMIGSSSVSFQTDTTNSN